MHIILVRGGRMSPLGVVPALLVLLVVLGVWLALQLLQPHLPSALRFPFLQRSQVWEDNRPGLQFVSLADAEAGVESFTGVRGARLTGSLQTGRFGERSYSVYYLEAADGTDFFKVDARTGEVIEATMRSRLELPPLSAPLKIDEAQLNAESFARDRFAGFDDLVLVSRSASISSDGRFLYAFKWAALARESGAELPVSVFISIAAHNGQVVWYLAQRDPVEVDTRPAIPEQEAVARAAAYLRTDARWDLSRPLSSRLMVVYDESNRQRLAWSITFGALPQSADPSLPRPSLRLLVDAHSGQLLQQPFQQPKG